MKFEGFSWTVYGYADYRVLRVILETEGIDYDLAVRFPKGSCEYAFDFYPRMPMDKKLENEITEMINMYILRDHNLDI